MEKDDALFINRYKQAYGVVYEGVNNPDILVHTKKDIKRAIS
jgi:hypothetical protein